jgi:molybdate transport system substrate-binding protein
MKFIHVMAALALGTLGASGASPAPIKVICTQALTAAMADIGPQFEKASGHKLVIDLGTTGALAGKVRKGEPVDVVLLAASVMSELARDGKLAGSPVEVARSPVGVAVKSGAPKPDLSSADAFRRALLDAPSVAYSDPADGGASGVAFAHLLDRLGMTDALRPKARLVKNGGRVGDVLTKGDAALGVQMVSELLPVEGIDIVGPLPKEIEIVTPFSAGIAANATQSEGGKAFIAFLATPAAVAALRRTGIEPAQ